MKCKMMRKREPTQSAKVPKKGNQCRSTGYSTSAGDDVNVSKILHKQVKRPCNFLYFKTV